MLLFNSNYEVGVFKRLSENYELVIDVGQEEFTLTLSDEEMDDLEQHLVNQENLLIPFHKKTKELILRNSHGSAGFSVDIGNPKSIYLFESPIDVLSYWSTKKERLKNTRLVSMSGLKRQTMIEEIKQMGKEGHKMN